MAVFTSRLTAWLAVIGSVVFAAAQSVAPSNASVPSSPLGETVDLVYPTAGQVSATYMLVPESWTSLYSLPSSGLSGNIVMANTTKVLQATTSSIVFISCDPSAAYAGNIGPFDLFKEAAQVPVLAVVFYSKTSQWCLLNGYNGPFQNTFSTVSPNQAQYLIGAIEMSSNSAYQTLAILPNTTSSSNTNNTAPGSSLPPPGTQVAMVILYSITGVITAIFVFIIVSGAVRAHRHPERYGPRGGMGVPRQSRARGLAKAMLDTLPIVRFGERDPNLKETDVEMVGGNGLGPASGSEAIHSEDKTVSVMHAETQDSTAAPETSTPAGQDEITSSITASRPLSHAPYDNQGCSICTDDFEIGQEQRVLPCDHRFHPACIDPWLLNVSGTCPLCRIDLRPKDRQAPDSSNAGERAEDELAPPLDPMEAGSLGWRTNVRRSTILGLLGTSRPGSMTREQRLVALRELRRRNLSRSRPAASTDSLQDTAEEEPSARRRWRNSFHGRVRRTAEGEHGSTESEPSARQQQRHSYHGSAEQRADADTSAGHDLPPPVPPIPASVNGLSSTEPSQRP